MKRIMMMAAMVLLAALAVSCQKEEIGVENLPTFTAHADNGGMKTDLVGNIIHWNSSDQVKMFGDFGYAIYGVTPRSDDPTWATLSPISNNGLVGLAPYRFIYPASMAEGGTANNSTLYVTYPAERNIDDAPLKYFPMYGESDQSDVAFRNLGGLLKIVLPEIVRNVVRIEVKADEAMSGVYVIGADGGLRHAWTENTDYNGIRVSADQNGEQITEGREVYVGVPAGEYHNVKIMIVDAEGYAAEKSGALVNVAQSAVTTIALSNLAFERVEYEAATLQDEAFRGMNVGSIIFHYRYNDDMIGAERIDDNMGSTPIYRVITNNVCHVYTPAAEIYAPVNCRYLFGSTYSVISPSPLTHIDFGDGFNTSNVTNMSNMFSYCLNLRSLDLSGFNTANVTNMGDMFSYCENLTSLNLSHFNTANVTNMGAMFFSCKNLSSLDLSSFNTENVTNMYSMFSDCQSLTSLDLSSFNTANVTNMGAMFFSCKNLSSLDLSSFNTANVTNMSGMFYHCDITSLDLSSFNTANVTSMSDMFRYCQSLTSLDLSSFNTANVTSMSCMFYECENLTSLDLSSFNTANVTSMDLMFLSCSKMTSIEFASTATINSLTDINGMLGYLGKYATGGCTIHCNDGVKNRLMSSGTRYNATYVHFNTVY